MRKRNEKLPQKARRHLKVQTFGFRKRILVFFVCFLVSFGAFVFSFLRGTGLGLWMNDMSKALMGWIASGLVGLGDATGVHVVVRLMEGMAKFLQLDFISVVMSCLLVSVIVSMAVAAMVTLVRTRDLWQMNRPNVTMSSGWQERYSMYKRL